VGKGLCGFAKAQLAIAQAVGINPADVVLSWSYSTQSINDTFGYLAQAVPAQTIRVQATGLTTKALNPAAAGKANVYAGTTSTPYYLTKSATPSSNAVLTSFWTAAGPSPVPGLDPASRNLTRFNPVPNKTADLAIPVFVTAPNATAAGGACVKPAAGWPVAIVQHGLGGNRLQAVAMADSFADACFVVAAIDMPLHGVTDTTNPFYQKDNERTFNVDLVNNVTGAPPADGKIDNSGQHWINLSSPLTGRDNWRQGTADLIAFSKTVARLDLDNDGTVDVDPTRVSYVGISLGGIMGSNFLAFAPNVRTGTVSVPGGVITRLALDSQTFSPQILAGLSAQGLVKDSTIFNNYFRDYQSVIDAGDPYNLINAAQKTVPLHLQKVVGDTVVPNSSTDRLIAAGALKKISTLGPTPVGKGTGGYTTMTAGSHGSLFDPTSSPAATVEMQTQAVKFAASANQPGGPFVVITNTSIVQQ
jgi:dienelactone hydrolase